MSQKKTPNPHGKLGGPEHRKKVKEVAQQVNDRGLTAILERLIELITGKKRFVDVAGVDDSDEIQELHQIGKQTKKGLPVKRERVVIEEIEQSKGIKPEFHPYNETDKNT